MMATVSLAIIINTSAPLYERDLQASSPKDQLSASQLRALKCPLHSIACGDRTNTTVKTLVHSCQICCLVRQKRLTRPQAL
jgi:hypothetical protein